MKVLTSTYSAEFGRTAGGVEMFQVKSGTSKYHGAAMSITSQQCAEREELGEQRTKHQASESCA